MLFILQRDTFDGAPGEILIALNWLCPFQVHHLNPNCRNCDSGCSFTGSYRQGVRSDGTSAIGGAGQWGGAGEG